jgi:hypothetical protein
MGSTQGGWSRLLNATLTQQETGGADTAGIPTRILTKLSTCFVADYKQITID